MKKNHFDYAVETAIEAFWNDVASSYPEVKTGDLSPDRVMSFEQEARAALNQWLGTNVADKDHTSDEQCQRYVNDDCCPICNVGHGEGCPECKAQAYHKPGCKLSDEGSVLENLDVILDEPDYDAYSEEDWRQDWHWDVNHEHTTLGFEEWKADEIAKRAFERDQALREEAKAEHEGPTPNLLEYVIEHFREEANRGGFDPDCVQDVKDIFNNAVDAYEGGAR